MEGAKLERTAVHCGHSETIWQGLSSCNPLENNTGGWRAAENCKLGGSSQPAARPNQASVQTPGGRPGWAPTHSGSRVPLRGCQRIRGLICDKVAFGKKKSLKNSNIIQNCAILCDSMQNYAILCDSMQNFAILCDSVQNYAILCGYAIWVWDMI